MYNITSDEYKKAIKAKYEIEKSGDYSKYLISPTQANLRKLCWERFRENNNTDDLNTFQTFFDFEFSTTKKNQLKEQTDKLKPIRAFFIGKTESPTDETIDFAAILVDFEFRPYRKFEKKAGTKNDQSIGNAVDSEIVNEEGRSEIEKEAQPFFEEKKENYSNSKKENSSIKYKFFERLFNRSKPAMITTAVIFSLIGTTIYFAFIERRCMQWSDNHYEIVNCDKPIEGNLNDVVQRDNHLLNFKKIEVFDTTLCFKPNREAIVWYSKTDNKVDFFNTDGKHPISKKLLKPVTQHIIDKYAKKTLKNK